MIYLDSEKISITGVYNALTHNGFTKTKSKRFRRFEMNKDNYTLGVEISTYNEYIVLGIYARHTLGEWLPINWGNELDKKLSEIFTGKIKDFKISL